MPNAGGERGESFDAVVIGSGFGGAVTARRLVEAGFHVCVLERGRRYTASDYPEVPLDGQLGADMARWLWDYGQGLWDVRDLSGVYVAQSAAYGGGSHVYANVHLRAPASIFRRGWPKSIRRAVLDPYYDLVGHALSIRPMDAAATIPAGPVEKTKRFEAAAAELGRVPFRPPLAVHFGPPATNQFGVTLQGCKGCGRCDLGCPHDAKNTLDRNYLRVVDESPLADVRTLAEARVVSQLPRDGDVPRYEVLYHDHLRDRRERVRADAVFVCAGAVNTTELLLRSRDPEERGREYEGVPDPLKHKGVIHVGPQLGKRFFANADSLGVVYDTAEEHRPTYGPVITTAVAHRHGKKGFFLIEDGGYPPELDHLTGLLQSVAWLARNRHAGSKGSGGARPTSPNAPPLESLPIDPLLGSVRVRLSFLDTLQKLVASGALSKVVSPQLARAFAQLQAELEAQQALAIRPVVRGVRNALLDRLATRIRKKFPLGGSRLGNVASDVVRWVATQGVGTEEEIAEQTFTTIEEVFQTKTPHRWGEPLVRWILGIPSGAAPPGSTADLRRRKRAVLLAMGCDDGIGELRIATEEDVRSGRALLAGSLLADLRLLPHGDVYTAEERLMRDFASCFQGELRTNPTFSFARRPITVHPQGGCAMADSPDDGVTNAYGEVHGQPNLFVNDAALFPKAVGVNPSSTIAALAERNVEHFIRRRHPTWRAPERARAQTWAETQRAAGVHLEPPSIPVPPLRSQPIGIRFTETMLGFHAPMPTSARFDRHAPPDLDLHRRAEILGRKARRRFEFTLDVAAVNLHEFFLDPKRRLEAKGTLGLVSDILAPDGAFVTVPVEGKIELLVTGKHANERFMGYVLEGTYQGKEVRLEGTKWLHDHPGFDAWLDATTLYVHLSVAGMETFGIVHIPVEKFAYEQLPSLHVTGTDDPARIAAAVTDFAAYFAEALQGVYAPSTARMIDLLRPRGVR